jgi:hypothetical protein
MISRLLQDSPDPRSIRPIDQHHNGWLPHLNPHPAYPSIASNYKYLRRNCNPERALDRMISNLVISVTKIVFSRLA